MESIEGEAVQHHRIEQTLDSLRHYAPLRFQYRNCPLIGLYFTSFHKSSMSLAEVPCIHFFTRKDDL